MDETNGQKAIRAEPPLGIFEAKCDEKGRLKLPVRFATYLKALGVHRVFITTLDLAIAGIYTETVWESNQNLFDNAAGGCDIHDSPGLVVRHERVNRRPRGRGAPACPS